MDRYSSLRIISSDGFLHYYTAPSPVSDEVKLLSSMALADEKSKTLSKKVRKFTNNLLWLLSY